MKFTIEWLKEHLDTKFNDQKIIDKLTNVGLEVESFENQTSELDDFIVAKIVKSDILFDAKKSSSIVFFSNIVSGFNIKTYSVVAAFIPILLPAPIPKLDFESIHFKFL